MSRDHLSILVAIYTAKVARGCEPTAEELEAFLGRDVWDEDITELERQHMLATTVGGAAPLRLTERAQELLLKAAGRSAA